MMNKMFNNLDARLADTNNKNVMKLLKNKKRITEGMVAIFSVLICQYFIKILDIILKLKKARIIPAFFIIFVFYIFNLMNIILLNDDIFLLPSY